ncbi:LysR family transcriptional regulator [Pelosinus sp. sgz500959]|uniref:LysR family transcriptional regulator n=1 Tax=Pelosinus sp. sgz500959 TaxID=3242472 RepID=UPI0036706D5E
MELRQLQTFCTAAETLNFTKAALKLGYVQSNITSQIRQLEEELKVKLFDRFGRRLELTSEGKKFLKQAENILQLCERAKDELSPESFRGTLTIGAAEALCVYRLPKLLLEYRKRYPFVEIRVQTESYKPLSDLIRNNSIDIALALSNQIDPPDLDGKALFNEKMIVVVSPFHPLAQKKQLEPKDLSNECLILSPEGCGYRPIILAVLEKYDLKLSGIMELSSVGARKECAICGLGVTILPKIAAKSELEQGKLMELDWKGPSFDVKTQVMWHREKWLSPIINAFLELCNSIKN